VGGRVARESYSPFACLKKKVKAKNCFGEQNKLYYILYHPNNGVAQNVFRHNVVSVTPEGEKKSLFFKVLVSQYYSNVLFR
jgi:hypothetical protein